MARSIRSLVLCLRGFRFLTRTRTFGYQRPSPLSNLLIAGAHFLTVIGALQPQVSVGQANAELSVFSQNLRQQHMDIMRFVDGFVAVPLQEGLHPRRARRTYRTPGRRRVHSIDRLREYREPIAFPRDGETTRDCPPKCARRKSRSSRAAVLTESAVLATAGGALGILLTKGSFSFLKALIPGDLSRTLTLTLNLPVLAFAILISVASTFLFGLTPALQISKTDVSDSLKEGGRVGAGRRSKSLGNLLVVGEVALSLVLLVASGLLLKSFANLRGLDPGFRSRSGAYGSHRRARWKISGFRSTDAVFPSGFGTGESPTKCKQRGLYQRSAFDLEEWYGWFCRHGEFSA